MIKKIYDMESFFKAHSQKLLALSIFLLITIELKVNAGTLNETLAMLAAGISYLILLEMMPKDKEKAYPDLTLGIMNTFLYLFTLSFCVWVILNLIDFSSNFSIGILILWVVFMMVIPYKISNKITKIILTVLYSLTFLYIIFKMLIH